MDPRYRNSRDRIFVYLHVDGILISCFMVLLYQMSKSPKQSGIFWKMYLASKHNALLNWSKKHIKYPNCLIKLCVRFQYYIKNKSITLKVPLSNTGAIFWLRIMLMAVPSQSRCSQVVMLPYELCYNELRLLGMSHQWDTSSGIMAVKEEKHTTAGWNGFQNNDRC